MIKSVFLISFTGEVLIEKHYRGVTTRSVCDFFWDELSKYEFQQDIPPIFSNGKYFIVNVQRGEMFLLACMTGEVPPLLAIEFLHRVLDILLDYFKFVDETVIKENFSTVYQILEEMMDYGYPFTTEPNALKAMIEPPSVMGRLTAAATGKSNVKDVLPDGAISNIPWRRFDVKYAQNEIFFDMIEEVDAIIDCTGMVISTELSGFILTNSKLSGFPDLTMTLENPNVIEDCSLHPCVRYNRFEQDKILSFVPPDGQFELIRYRISNENGFSPPIFCTPKLFQFGSQNHHHGTIEVIVGQKAQHSLIFPRKKSSFTLEDVVVSIPFPKTVKTASLSVTHGSCLYDESTKIAKWTIGKLTKNQTLVLNGTVVVTGGHQSEESPPINITWTLPSASISGLNINSLRMSNERYQPYKGVRTIARAGNFQVRTV